MMKVSGFFKCIYCLLLHFIHIIIASDMKILFPFSIYCSFHLYTQIWFTTENLLLTVQKYRERQSINWKHNFKLLMDSLRTMLENGKNEKNRRLIHFQNGLKLSGHSTSIQKTQKVNEHKSNICIQRSWCRRNHVHYLRQICCNSCR